MADRTWKADQIKSLVAELLSLCGGGTTERVNLRAETRKLLDMEIELLVKRVNALVDESQRKKYYAARFAYRHRKEMTPGVRREASGKAIGPVTWETWFSQIFRDDLERYMAECKEHDVMKQVYEYEIVEFGSSALEDDMKRREQRREVA